MCDNLYFTNRKVPVLPRGRSHYATFWPKDSNCMHKEIWPGFTFFRWTPSAGPLWTTQTPTSCILWHMSLKSLKLKRCFDPTPVPWLSRLSDCAWSERQTLLAASVCSPLPSSVTPTQVVIDSIMSNVSSCWLVAPLLNDFHSQTNPGCCAALRSPRPGLVLGASTHSSIKPSAQVCQGVIFITPPLTWL